MGVRLDTVTTITVTQKTLADAENATRSDAQYVFDFKSAPEPLTDAHLFTLWTLLGGILGGRAGLHPQQRRLASRAFEGNFDTIIKGWVNHGWRFLLEIDGNTIVVKVRPTS